MLSETQTTLPTLLLAELEQLAIEAALRDHAGNRTRAAKTLGISLRTLQRKIRRYGLPAKAGHRERNGYGC